MALSKSFLLASLTCEPLSSLLPAAIIEAALLETPQFAGDPDDDLARPPGTTAALLFPTATPLVLPAASEPSTLDAKPCSAVQLPPKEPSKLEEDGGFNGVPAAGLGLSAGLVREGWRFGIAGEALREPKGESNGEAETRTALLWAAVSGPSPSRPDRSRVVRGRSVDEPLSVVMVRDVVVVVGLFMALNATTAAE